MTNYFTPSQTDFLSGFCSTSPSWKSLLLSFTLSVCTIAIDETWKMLWKETCFKRLFVSYIIKYVRLKNEKVFVSPSGYWKYFLSFVMKEKLRIQQTHIKIRSEKLKSLYSNITKAEVSKLRWDKTLQQHSVMHQTFICFPWKKTSFTALSLMKSRMFSLAYCYVMPENCSVLLEVCGISLLNCLTMVNC